MGPLSAAAIAFWLIVLEMAPAFSWWGPVKPSVFGWITLIVVVLILLDAFVLGTGRWVRYRVRGPRGASTERA